MADLTDIQKDAVRQWVAAGASLSEVQNRLKEEFDLLLTYMDVRLLTLDIDAKVKDKPEPKKAPPAAKAAGGIGGQADPRHAADGEALATEGQVPVGGGAVTVELDRLMRPGALVSGDVTFSDGTKAKWLLDQTGRLGLDGAPTGYRPSEEDLREFQTQLQQVLASKGY